MREAERTFRVNSTLEKVWSFCNNIGEISWCIPGTTRVTELGPEEVALTVRASIGFAVKTMDFIARVVKRQPPNLMVFEAKSEDANIRVELNLSAISESETLIRYKLTIIPISALANMAASLMGDTIIDQQSASFAECIQNKLQSFCNL